jgi:hypothetical protein
MGRSVLSISSIDGNNQYGTSSIVLKTSHAPITSGDERESDHSRSGPRR